LREAPIWFGALAFDLLASETWLVKEPPWNAALAEWTPRPWSPQDDMRATFWLQNHGIAVTPATVAQAIETVAHDQEYNPLTDYLSNLEFDGQPRLNTWMPGYLGTAQNEYTAAVGRCSMIAAIARAYMPGCKSDAMPILEGIQGARKSTAVKTLFDPWFTDELADFGSKDAAMQLRGSWGVEVSELDAMSRGEISRVKAFTSRTTDRFRPPYGARVIESPRSCVFWGTTNAEGYLKDETGGRRFWPVKVGKIKIEALERDRDQLWAEARFLFDAGASWWITNPNVIRDAERHQQDRYQGDPWDRDIAAYVRDEGEVNMERIMRDVLGLELGRRTPQEHARVARILRSMGFNRHQKGTGDRREWVYRRTVKDGPSVDQRPGAEIVTIYPSGDRPAVVSRETPAAQSQAPFTTSHHSIQK
jgi:predicted P-loop ATPase